MVKPTLINRNLLELKYYPFMISLNKFDGSCNDLSRKICVSEQTKDINVKAFGLITNKEEAKAITEHISCDCKCKFNSTTCNLNENWNNKTGINEKLSNVNVKIIVSVKIIIVGILAHAFVKIVSI